MELNASITRWVAEFLGDPVSVKPLPGATSSLIAKIEGRTRTGVLRLFNHERWIKEEPDVAAHEAASLAAVSAWSVETPELIASDTSGERCGKPAVLMSFVAGRPKLTFTDHEYEEMGRVLSVMHASPVTNFNWNYCPYITGRRLTVPGWTSIPNQWAQAIRFVRTASPPPFQATLIHRDFHPANLLWTDHHLTAVIDWVNACIGPPGVDVGHCRVNLALLHGLDSANRFLAAYKKHAGAAFTYDPFWDFQTLFDFALPGPPAVYKGWTDFGVKELTNELMRKRLDLYLTSVIHKMTARA